MRQGPVLGATTGVVAASVILMGLIAAGNAAHGYDARIACGVIASSGTLALVVPPSLMPIIVAEQLLGTTVGDMYAAALLPAALLTGLFALLVAGLAVWRPDWLPALPAQRRTLAQADGSAGYRSLLVFVLLRAVPAPSWWAAIRRCCGPPAANSRRRPTKSSWWRLAAPCSARSCCRCSMPACACTGCRR